LGNIGLQSEKVSLKVMPFLLTSKCSHIKDNWEIRGHKENNDGIKTTEDAMVLKGHDGKPTYMLKDIGRIEWVKNT
jgi:hypothetical protein